jgi:hypothetical protein
MPSDPPHTATVIKFIQAGSGIEIACAGAEMSKCWLKSLKVAIPVLRVDRQAADAPWR